MFRGSRVAVASVALAITFAAPLSRALPAEPAPPPPPATWPAEPDVHPPLPRMAPDGHAPRFSSVWLGVRAGSISYSGNLGVPDVNAFVGTGANLAVDLGLRTSRYTIFYAAYEHDLLPLADRFRSPTSSVASDYAGLGLRTSDPSWGSPDGVRLVVELEAGARRLAVSRDGSTLEKYVLEVFHPAFGVEWRASSLLSLSLLAWYGLYIGLNTSGSVALNDGTSSAYGSTNAGLDGAFGATLGGHFDVWGR